MSDHSHESGRGGHEPVRRARRLARPRAGATWSPKSAELAVCPGSRSAQVYVLTGAIARRLAARVAADLDGVQGWTWWPGWKADEGVVAPRAASCASRRARRLRTHAATAGAWTGDLAALDLAVEDGAVRGGDYPDALRRLWSALTLPARRRRAAVRRAGVRVHRLGRAPTTWAGAATVAARVRLAGGAADLRRRPRPPSRRRGRGRSRTSRRWCWTTSGWRPDVARRESAPAYPHARAPGHGPAPQLGAAGQVLRGRRFGLRGQPGRVRRGGEGGSTCTTWWRPRWRSWWP